MKLQVFLPAVLAVFLATQSSSFADGGFVTSFTSHYPQLQEPEQKGIVLYQEGREDLLLEVKYQGAAEDFVWLVPLPSRPEVTVDAEGVFADMRRQIQFWQPPSAVDPWRPGQGERFLPRRAYQPAASIWNFEVLPPERKVLEKWIDDHALNVSANARRVLDRYVQKGWYFVGMSIDPGNFSLGIREGLRNGTIQPVRFRFDTPEPVFPLRISSINPGFSDILLYVFADKALVNRTAGLASWDNRCYGRLPLPKNLQNAWRDSGTIPFLTRLTARFNAWEMTEDVYFRDYDPRRDLKDRDPFRRLGAVAWIGAAGDPNRASDLLRIVEHGDSDDVVQAAAWALGRIGGPEAAPVLERLTGNPSNVRYEALHSLIRIDPQRAVRALLADFLSPPPTRPDLREPVDGLQFVIDALMSLPDTLAVAALSDIESRQGGRGHWLALKSDDVRRTDSVSRGVYATAILAARGDPLARKAIVDALVKGAQDRETPAQPPGPPETNMTASGTIEISTIMVVSTVRPRYWPALATLVRVFAQHPEIRTALLSEAAAREELPQQSRDVLMSLVGRPAAGEFADLR